MCLNSDDGHLTSNHFYLQALNFQVKPYFNMNVPINHHYVSRSHQSQFFNDSTGRIYLYDKEWDNFYHRTTTKSVFSEDHLNTRFTNGEFDQKTLEFELQRMLEDDFNNHVAQVKKFVNTRQDQDETCESLYWLTLYGIVGEMRHPIFKRQIDETLDHTEFELLVKHFGVDEPTAMSYIESKKVTPYHNNISYIEVALKIIEKLDPIEFEIYVIESSDHFLLPDTSCWQLRGQLNYYPNNFIKEIIQIGLPISDKIFVLVTPQSRNIESHSISVMWIDEDESPTVDQINRDLFSFSKKAVACKDESYLKEFIGRFTNSK